MADKNTLVTRIAFEGGKAVRDELKALGADGEAALGKIIAATEKLEAAQKGLPGFFLNLRKQMDTIAAGADKVRTGFATMTDGIVRFGRNVAIVSTAITGAVIGLVGLTKGAADAADEQGKAAAAAGLAIDTYGKLQFAFEQGNVAQEAFQTGMKKFNVVLADAAAGGSKSLQAFKDLGVNIRDASGNLRPTGDIIGDIADKFAKLPNSAQKSALAVQLFGKAGAAFIPVLNDGSKALKDLGDQAERAGRVFTEQQAAVGDAFGDSLNLFLSTLNGIKNQFALTLAPALTEAFSGLTKVLQDNSANIKAIGESISGQIIPFIKDFIALLTGKDGDVVNKNLIGIRDGFIKVGEAIITAINLIGTVFTVLKNTIQPLVDLYNATLGKVFGEIDAQTAIITVALFALTGGFKAVSAAVTGTRLVFAGLAEIFGTTAAAAAGVVARVLLVLGLIKTMVQDMVQSASEASGAFIKGFQDAINAVIGFFSNLGSEAKTVLDDITGWIQNIINGAKAAAAAVSSIFGGGGGDSGQAFASGGHVRGPGTGTSDSIMARLSNGEFVVRAAAVRKYGVEFLQAINNMRSPGFAMGGLVARPAGAIPAFAGGGLVDTSARTPLTLNIGGQVFENLMAPDSVAAKLVEFAHGQNIRSGGKKPSWMKG